MIWIISVTLVGFLFSIAILQVVYVVRKFRMKRKERKLLKAGVVPSGSEISHGIVVDKSSNKVVSVEKKTPEWYRRLLR